MKLTIYQRKLAKLIIGGLLYTITMIIGTYLLGLFVVGNEKSIPIYLMLIMLVMIGVYIYRVIIAKKKEKLLFARYGTLITLFTALAIFSILTSVNGAFYYVVGIGYAFGLIIDRTFSLFHKHEGRNIFLAVVIDAYAIMMITLFLIPVFGGTFGDNSLSVYSLVPLTLIITSFIDAIKLVFSGLRRKTLIEIIKKTYTIEILYGLLTLIVATSILLMNVEEGFNNYGDALWYCFAVVTTIGFGDFTVTSIVGRMLTVVLGMYGIIVVALITSIIVNFYNESSSSRGDKEIKKEIKKLDEERRTIADEEDGKKGDKE